MVLNACCIYYLLQIKCGVTKVNNPEVRKAFSPNKILCLLIQKKKHQRIRQEIMNQLTFNK